MKLNRNKWTLGPEVDSVDVILQDRGLKIPEKRDLHDPFLLTGMSVAVERIQRAMRDGEVVCVFGDYDVDGITSTSILMKCFDILGLPADYYIPSRENEGYGLSKHGLDTVKEEGQTLVITVDCGINAFEEASYAKEIGLDLIITDHHEIEEALPEAVAVINPKREGYPFPYLAGCGVALKLAQALLGERFWEEANQLLDLAAIGTIADMVSLTDENRAIATFGLANIQNVGIKALSKVANKDYRRLKTGDIGYALAPMLNSAGRIGNPKMSVELLLQDDLDLAERIALRLNEVNRERQAQSRRISAEAIEMVEKNIPLDRDRVIVVAGRDWHAGVVGLSAAKLVEKYGRPAIVLTEVDGELRGSSRSIPGVSIYDVIAGAREFLTKFGGHEQAAGMSLPKENLEAFTNAVNKVAENFFDVRHIQPTHAADYVLPEGVLDMRFVESLEALEPCGIGNPEPVFCMNHLMVEGIRNVGVDSAHVKIELTSGKNALQGIAFQMADRFKGIRTKDEISLLFTAEMSVFRGTESLNLMVKDVHSGIGVLYDAMLRRLEEATVQFLLKRGQYKFTSLCDFDIMTQLNVVEIFTLEDLQRVAQWAYEKGVDCEVVFGDEAPLQEMEYDLLVRFMPIDSKPGESTGLAFVDFVPTRAEMEKAYLRLRGREEVNIREFAKILAQHVVKLRLSMELLRQLGLLEFEIVNDYAKMRWLTPNEVMKLEDLPLYQKMMRETSLMG